MCAHSLLIILNSLSLAQWTFKALGRRLGNLFVQLVIHSPAGQSRYYMPGRLAGSQKCKERNHVLFTLEEEGERKEKRGRGAGEREGERVENRTNK